MSTHSRSEKRPGSASNRSQSSSSKTKDDSFERNDGSMPATRELIQYSNEYRQNLDRLINRSKKELEEIEASVACKRQDPAKLKDLEIQLITKNEETQKLKDDYQEEIYKMQQKIQDLQRYIDCLKNGNNREGNKTYANKKEDYDDIKKRLERKENELRLTKLELDDTKTRLSKFMGDKLTDNNPNITDLSDMNRPTKLAERYRELYDNQWTDAFELLEKRLGEDENQNISILLTVFTKTKEFCEQESKRQMEEIQKVITQSEKVRKMGVPDLVVKYIKDCMKASSAESIREVDRKYQAWLRSGQLSYLKYATSIKDYTDECFKICWLMAIQDPPVVLAPEPKPGEHIQPELYSAYTVSGNTVDFLVWPALLLHKDGPVLAKGVVQALKRAKSAPAVVRTGRSKDFQSGHDIGHRISRTKNEGMSSRNIPEAWTEEDDVRNKYRTGKRYDQDAYRDVYGHGGSSNYVIKDLQHEKPVDSHRTRGYDQIHRTTHMGKTTYNPSTYDRTPYTPSNKDVNDFLYWKRNHGIQMAVVMMGDKYDIIKEYLDKY